MQRGELFGESKPEIQGGRRTQAKVEAVETTEGVDGNQGGPRFPRVFKTVGPAGLAENPSSSDSVVRVDGADMGVK